MQKKLIPASHGFVFSILLMTLLIVSIKPDALNLSPSIPLSCDATIITDVADVKPTVTGIDIKSISTSVIIILMKYIYMKY